MKRIVAIAAALCCTMSMASETGTLTMLPWADNFDWDYKTGVVHRNLFEQSPRVLQTTFKWNGPNGAMLPQHAVLAYTQTLANDRFNNGYGAQIWSHGAGAIVGEFGLGLELWFRSQNADGSWTPPNAYVWTQASGGCMQDVQGTVPPGTLCLPSQVDGGGYLTHNPGFTLRRNTLYTVRITYKPDGAWTNMLAELWDGSGALLQSGRIGFSTAQFLPSVAQPVTPAIARTPGTPSEPTVGYTYTVVPQ